MFLTLSLESIQDNAMITRKINEVVKNIPVTSLYNDFHCKILLIYSKKYDTLCEYYILIYDYGLTTNTCFLFSQGRILSL